MNGFRPLVDLCKRDDVDSEIPVLVVQSLAHLAAHHSKAIIACVLMGAFVISICSLQGPYFE